MNCSDKLVNDFLQGHRHLRAFETFDWRVDHLLDKVQKLVAAARGLTNQLLYDSLLVVHSMPRDGDLFECSSVSQNSLSGVLHREESASIFRRTDKEMGVVRHRGSQLVVGNIGERTGVVGRWYPLFRSTRVRPFLVEIKKFLHQIVGKKSNLNPCLDEGRVPIYRFVLVSRT